MNKLILSTIIAATMFSGLANAEYIIKIPLEKANGGFLADNSIVFKPSVLTPSETETPVEDEQVEDEQVDCLTNPTDNPELCEESLTAWEQFADDRGLYKDWNSLYWDYNNLTNIPIEPYPTTHVDTLFLSDNQLTSVGGLSNLRSANYLDLSSNQLTSVDGLSNIKSAGTINLSWNELTNISGLSGLTTATNIYLDNNQLTNLDGLSNITNAGTINLKQNNLTNVNGLANIAISDRILIDSSYSGAKLPASSRFCSLTPMNSFISLPGIASKSQLCEE